jgi:alpha-methylacyl-CoA racemase
MSGSGVTWGGPLSGIRVVEFGGIGPCPYVGQLLVEMGAEVLAIDRKGGNGWPNLVTDAGKSRLVLDLKMEADRQRASALLDVADVVIEGFRPGVMERLGLGPDVALARNQRLIYGRMTGWGQDGPLSQVAGHDINYIAITGALAAIGAAGTPSVPPLNLVGDFGGGALFLAFGIALALFERERSGLGQVIDAAIVDGVTSMMSFFSGMTGQATLSLDKDKNLLGGAAPFYRCYECADGKQISVGALEPHFYRELLERTGAPIEWLEDQNDLANWPERSAGFAQIFRKKTRAEWCDILEGTEACFAPVLTLEEARQSAHMLARKSAMTYEGQPRPTSVPRFSRSKATLPPPRDAETLLRSWIDGHR